MSGALTTSRRRFLQMSSAAAFASAAPWPVSTAFASQTAYPDGPVHGLSVFGDLKYGPDFTQFDYVNRLAPKGGTFSFQAPYWYFNQNVLTYNTFNAFILKGDAPPRMELCFDTLMVRAYDEPDAVYGLLAETVKVSEDGNVFTFSLRPEARFHDGSKLTAEDVAFSLLLLKADGHPMLSQPLSSLKDAVILDDHKAALQFDGSQSRNLPLVVAADYPIFSKRYYTAYDFKQSTLTPPLSSGPYKVGKHAVGHYVEYHQVENYWAKDLPVRVGHCNFAVIRVEFYRERQTAFEAFKKGGRSTARNSRPRTGQRSTIFRLWKKARSSAASFPMAGRQGRRAGSSTPGSTSSRTRACARHLDTPSISNGRTRTCSTGFIREPSPSSKTPT